MPLCTFQRKLRGCSGSPPAGAGGICPVERGRMEVRPLPGSPSCYDCLWVTCLLGCLSLCFNKCCFNARIYDLVNDNVSVHSNSSFSCLWPHPRWQPIPAPGSVSLHGPLLVHFGNFCFNCNYCNTHIPYTPSAKLGCIFCLQFCYITAVPCKR